MKTYLGFDPEITITLPCTKINESCKERFVLKYKDKVPGEIFSQLRRIRRIKLHIKGEQPRKICNY